MTENEVSYVIIGAIFKVYNTLGPGLLESIYEEALVYQMKKDGLKVEEQVAVPVYYDGHKLSNDLRLDILVEDQVILELKSVKELSNVNYKQLRSYLVLSHKKLGLLVNFTTDNIKESIHRVVNGL
jgi:GxxExxY protein